jgi:sterol desaturase/sphingolipid hydroxylase (fatty acid hydroxylase superfamily)
MDNGGWVRLSIFCITLLLVSLAELTWPRRVLTVPKWSRWFANLSIVIFDNLSARLFLPLLPLGAAELATTADWGVLNQLAIPVWLKTVLAVTFLDIVIYLQHRASHHWHWFWCLHRMHHTDLDLDVTTGVRFHPLEILISTLIKIGVVFLVGASPLSVLIFEVLLSSTALFNHGNFKLPHSFDKWLRLLLVTPDMHRVHHSVIPAETNSNFGFSVPWWDHLLNTYRDQPRDGHETMTIGLKEYRSPAKLGLWGLIMIPFRKPYG